MAHKVRFRCLQMVVHMGGKGSGFKNSDQQDEQDDDGTRLFHIRGTNEDNVRAVQVEEVAVRTTHLVRVTSGLVELRLLLCEICLVGRDAA